MRNVRVSLELATWVGLVFVTVLVLMGCSEGDADSFTGTASDHSLATALHTARPHLDGLDDSERAAIDTFIRYAGPASSKIEIRQILTLAGKGMSNAEPTVVADFLITGADHVYQEFFAGFDDSRLVAISEAMKDRPGADARTLSRYRGIVANARNGYHGPLSEAVGIVLFHEAVEPKPIPRAVLSPEADDSLELWTGGATLLGMKGFVAEGPSVELSVKAYEKALKKWPNDPVLLSGLVTLYVEYEDRYPEELVRAIEMASSRDRDNAAYAYLLAARHFRVGKDDEALAILARMEPRKLCSFYPIERAKRVVTTLEGAGYGALRARLTAYRAMSIAPYFDVKDLANRALLRSQEYEAEKREDALKTVLEFPGVLSRQIRAAPRVHHVESIRAKVLAVGLSRYSGRMAKIDQRVADMMRRDAESAELRVRAIQQGEKLGAGREAWAGLFDLLGEEEFLIYADQILFGNEAEFLIQCSEKTGIEQIVDLARVDYPF